MAKTVVELGTVVQNRGQYASNVKYYKDNIVQYQNSSYIVTSVPQAIGYLQNVVPTTPNSGWSVFAYGAADVIAKTPRVDVSQSFTDAEKKQVRANIGLGNGDIDDEPTAGSENLVKSGGVEENLYIENKKSVNTKPTDDSSDFQIGDENGNIIMAITDGQLAVKDFNSISTPKQKSIEEQSDALYIVDEKGNVIVEFSEGNVKTQNFDSSENKEINVNGNYDKMILGDFKLGTLNENNIISPSNTAIVSDTLGIPYENVSLHIKLKNNYTVTIRCGFVNGDHGTKYPLLLGTYEDGDIATLPLEVSSGNRTGYIRLQIQRKDGGEITASEDTGIELTYLSYYNILDSNADIINLIQAKSSVRDGQQVVNPNGRTIVVHGSDIHADWIRLYNLYKVASIVNADAVVLTGDFVAHNHYDGLTPMLELSRNSNIPTLICCGNHEVGFKYTGIGDFEVSDSDVYDYVFSELSETQNYLKVSGTVSDKPYYYYDIPSKNLRIISAYQYVDGTETAQSGYNNMRWVQHFNQDEADWLVATLLSTPNNYGIILLFHTPEMSQNYGKIEGNDLFFPVNWSFGNNQNSITNGFFLRELIDAFISRSTLSKTYNQNGTPSSFIVNADFSNVDSSIEFIGIMNGHYHQDAIGLVSLASERQVQLNIASTTGIPAQVRKYDCPRNIRIDSGNAFNVYVINRDTHSIDVYRIGTHRTIDGRNRVTMNINYKINN